MDGAKQAAKAIKIAIAQELAKGSESPGIGMFHSVNAFEITQEPGEPCFAVTVSPNVENTHGTADRIRANIIQPFGRQFGLGYRTFSGEMTGNTFELRAATWEDLLSGLSPMLERNGVNVDDLKSALGKEK